MRWLKTHPVGPVVFVATVGLLAVGQVPLPQTYERDAASTMDSTAALLYLALPLLAVFASVVTAWVERPWTVIDLGPVHPHRATMTSAATAVAWAAAGPVVTSLVTLLRTRDIDADPAMMAAVTVVPALWVALSTLIGYVTALVLPRAVAPLLAGVLVATLIVAGRITLYPLGHSAALSGMSPVSVTWVVPAALMGLSLACGLMVIVRLPAWARRWSPAVGAVMVIFLAVAGRWVPPQSFDVADGTRWVCTGESIEVCSPGAYEHWARATAQTAAGLHSVAKDKDVNLPVRRIIINAGDTVSDAPARAGDARVYLDSRNAPESMPSSQLAAVLVGANCRGGDDPALPAVAVWLDSELPGSQASLDDWPEFDSTSERSKRQEARRALAGVECVGQ